MNLQAELASATAMTVTSMRRGRRSHCEKCGDRASAFARAVRISLSSYCGRTLVTNVPQFANGVRGEFGIYSVANQTLWPSDTAAE